MVGQIFENLLILKILSQWPEIFVLYLPTLWKIDKQCNLERFSMF